MAGLLETALGEGCHRSFSITLLVIVVFFVFLIKFILGLSVWVSHYGRFSPFMVPFATQCDCNLVVSPGISGIRSFGRRGNGLIPDGVVRRVCGFSDRLPENACILGV